MKIAVTGANSSVGQTLLSRIGNDPAFEVIAGVRSATAEESLPKLPQIKPMKISFDDPDSIENFVEGADCVIHLAGILIENKHSNYAGANVEATRKIVEAAKRSNVSRLIFISVVGAANESENAYFKSKGQAEKLITESGISNRIIRTPILLGYSTAGASALKAQASQAKSKLLGGGHYSMRPLDVDDLALAIINCCSNQGEHSMIYELAGPESIKYRDIIQKAAAMMGNSVEIGSIPIWFAKLGAFLKSKLGGGGITPVVIDVITKDEIVENNAASSLGIELTPLQLTLEKFIEKKT